MVELKNKKLPSTSVSSNVIKLRVKCQSERSPRQYKVLALKAFRLRLM